MRLAAVSLALALVLTGGCQSEVRPTGAASRDGTIVAPVQVDAQSRDRESGSQAYANFAAAVLLHARSDRLISEAEGLELGTARPSRLRRSRLHQEAFHLWKQAVQRYEKVLLYDPKSVEACERLARGYSDRGDTERAVHWLKRAVAIDGGDFKLLFHLGVGCEELKRTREAVEAYTQAEKARPGPDKSRLLPLILLKLGRLYENQNQLDEAAATYIRFIEFKKEADDVYGNNTALIELLKNRAPAYRKLADVYTRQGKHVQAAEAFKTAYRLQPQVTRSLLGLASAEADAGDYPRAVETCKKYVEKEPNRLDGMTLLVDIYKKMGQPDKAVTAAEEFLKEKPLLYQLHYLLGTLREDRGEIEKAAASYGRIVGERKQFVPAYLRLAALEAKRGRYDKALAVFAVGLSAGIDEESFYADLDRRITEAAKVPGTPLAFRLAVQQENQDFAFYYVLGRLCEEMKRHAEAITAYREVIRRKPEFLHCYIRLASVYLVADKAEEAVKVLTSAGERVPQNMLIWRFLADAQRAAGDLPGAIDSMKRVVYLDLSNTTNTMLLVGLMTKAGQSEEAERFLERSLKEHPEDEERWTYILSTFYIDGNRKLDRAIELLNDALKEYPESGRLMTNLGCAHFRRHDYAKAVGVLRRAIEIDPENAGARTYLALALEEDGKLAEAEKELREAFRRKPDDHGLLVELGRLLVRSGPRAPEGIALIKQAIAAQPDDASHKLSLGNAYLRLKQYPDAVRVFTELLAKDPDYALARYQLAMAYDEMNLFPAAEGELQKILKDDPLDGPAANALGYMYAEHSVKLDEAQHLIELALKQEPENGAYLDSMGWVFYKKGDFGNALEYLKKAVEREPDAVIADHLGDVYFKLGQSEEARKRYEEAAKLDKNGETKAARKLQLLKAGKDPLVDTK